MQNLIDPLVTIHEVTLNLFSVDSSEKLLQSLLDQAVVYTKADTGTIALLNVSRKFLEIHAYHALSDKVKEKVKLKLGEGITGRCVLTGRTRNIGDISKDPYYVEINPKIKSELAIPLKLGGKTFGVLSVDSRKLNAFSDTHVDFLESMANYAVQIFSNRQAIENLNHKTEIQKVLLEVGTILGKHRNLKKVFHEIINILEAKSGLNRSAVFLYDKVINELHIVTSSNFSPAEIKRSHFKPKEGITGQVFSDQRAIAIADIEKDPDVLNKSEHKPRNKKTSFFASPIILNGESKGVFTMEFLYEGQSNFQDYSALVQIISSIFSQAIQIHQLIEQAESEIKEENVILKRQLKENFGFDKIIGSSKAIKDLLNKMRMSADTVSSVLLTGESGTGKELFATSLHQNSIRKDHNMIKINCAAIPFDLLESELFGYVKGAFTGANTDRKGKLLAAHKGTLFLDEIGEMDLKLQAKLLRFIQEREFSPLGTNEVFKVDVRIITATNRSLQEMIERGTFREDLFYRLNVLHFHIPSLRERPEDIGLISTFLVQKICKRTGKKRVSLAPETLKELEKYPFPGNIRELENILEKIIVLSNKSIIKAEQIAPLLKETISLQRKVNPPASSAPELSKAINNQFSLETWVQKQIKSSNTGVIHKNIIAVIEKEVFKQMLKKNLFNKSKASRELGLNRLTLDRKISEYNLIEELSK